MREGLGTGASSLVPRPNFSRAPCRSGAERKVLRPWALFRETMVFTIRARCRVKVALRHIRCIVHA